MATQIEIANFALISLGADPISSISESTPEAVSINAVWDMCRRTLLRLHPWNFAIKRVELAQSATAPNHGYHYRYALPVDCIRVLQVYNDDNYKLENGYILSNLETCNLKYVSDIKDTAQWTSDFSELMTEKLKAELAFGITSDKDLTKLYTQMYAAKLEQCRWNDASEDIEDPFLGESSLIEVRH